MEAQEGRPHNIGTGSRECWCNPRFAKPCPECDGEDPDCWKCDESGLITTDINDLDEVLIIHNIYDD